MSVLDLFKLDGKVALVTGGGQGIGRVFVLALAEAGADVVVADLNAKTAAEVVKEVEQRGRKAVAAFGNIAQEDDIKAIASNYLTGQEIIVDGGHLLSDWLLGPPPPRHVPALVSPKEESVSLIHDLDMLGIPHDNDGFPL